MEYITPNFTKDMVKTHKILIPNMAVTQFRLMQAALASEGYQTEVLGNCGNEVAQLGLKYVHNDTCYPALLVIGQFLDALNSGKYDLDHTALLITQTGGGCRASNYIHLLRKALVKAGYPQIPVASLNFSGLEKDSGFQMTIPLARRALACIFYGDMLCALRNQVAPYENEKGAADKMVDLLYKFTTAQWQELEGLFPAISSVIAENASVIERMNTFCGLNMAEAPGWVPSLAWSIPILAALTQWLSTKLMQGQQPKPDPDNPTAQSMQMMMVTMPLFSAFICITMPAGLGIYWIATSVVQIIQQLLVNSYMDKIDIDEMVKKNLEKVNKKRAKQGLPPAKITQNATASLKSIKEEEEREMAAEEIRREKTAKQIEESKRFYNETAKPGSLAAKAAMVQKYNEAHEKRGKNK